LPIEDPVVIAAYPAITDPKPVEPDQRPVDDGQSDLITEPSDEKRRHRVPNPKGAHISNRPGRRRR
jgi:hypothetical protein